MVQCRASYTFL